MTLRPMATQAQATIEQRLVALEGRLEGEIHRGVPKFGQTSDL
jgi:hypothetical protein